MTSDQLQTVDAVVRALGGNLGVTALVGGAHSSTVSNWKKVGRFPAKTHKIIKDALRERSLDAPDELWAIIHG